jgi:beta-glucosidase
VLSGRVQPSGRLPVQIPRHPGAQPSTYLQPPLGGVESTGITTVDTAPLYPFGYGRSYTSFTVSDMSLGAAEMSTDGEITATARVQNTGASGGSEVVQLYLHDVLAEVARPVRQLIGFIRVQLEPGESREVGFTVHADRFAYTNRNYDRVVEAGDVQLLLGTSATDLPCRETVRVFGPTRVVGHDRRLVTPVAVR